MKWKINRENGSTVVVLEREIGIKDAAAFYEAVLAVAVTGGDVRLDAGAATTVHTSIMQILYALSQAVPGFGVSAASGDFLAAEVRVGLSLARNGAHAIAPNQTASAEVPCG